MIYGYARVSSKGQNLYGTSLESQEQQLREAGATVIYKEAFTGTKQSRPQLDALIGVLKPGDTLVVTKLDRVARSIRAGIDIMDNITSLGCRLNILNMGVFDNSPNGKLMRNIFLSFAEFERDMIVQRTSEGKEIRRATDPGWRDGRKSKELSDFQKFFEKQKGGVMSVEECCKALGISRRTWYNRIKELTPTGV